MRIIETLLRVLGEVLWEEPVLSNLHLSRLQTWFDAKKVHAFVWFYSALADEPSRNTFLKLVRNSVGQFFCGNIEKFRNYPDKEWNEYCRRAASLKGKADSYMLDLVETFILNGYSYENICQVARGDTVLDCGAYNGNTALFFADLTGPDGRVYAFEPMETTFNSLCENVKNSAFNNIFPVRAAVLRDPGTAMFSDVPSAASRVDSGTSLTPAVSIDAFVDEYKLDRVDFIKMDIEGSEMAAIEGASRTIRAHKPKLAICLYHRDDDFISIPQKILTLCEYYRFYLKHNSNDFYETVLFALPETKANYTVPAMDSTYLPALWKDIELIHDNRQIHLRKLLLSEYKIKLKESIPYIDNIIIDKKHYRFMQLPITTDGNLHYEYTFTDVNCIVALHFEGIYSKYDSLIKEISSLSKLKTPLTINNGKYKGCSFLISEYNDSDIINSYMCYLIETTLPFLIDRRLVSDRIILKMNLHRYSK